MKNCWGWENTKHMTSTKMQFLYLDLDPEMCWALSIPISINIAVERITRIWSRFFRKLNCLFSVFCLGSANLAGQLRMEHCVPLQPGCAKLGFAPFCRSQWHPLWLLLQHTQELPGYNSSPSGVPSAAPEALPCIAVYMHFLTCRYSFKVKHSAFGHPGKIIPWWC